MPNMVVLRYFSWPARSIKVTTFADDWQMCTQSSPPAYQETNKTVNNHIILFKVHVQVIDKSAAYEVLLY